MLFEAYVLFSSRIARRFLGALLVALLPVTVDGRVEAESIGEPRPIELQDFVVTATRTRQAADTVPVRVESVAASNLAQMGARSLADAVGYLPGVHVESNCQSCNTTDIRLMGLDGAYNQVVFDGLPLLSSLAGVYGLEQIPAGVIERIEVVKGGGSSLYGANAVAGVVNIVSRSVRASGVSSEIRLDSIRGRSAWMAGAVIEHLFQDGRSAVTGYLQAATHPEIDLNADGFSELAKRRLQTAGFRGSLVTGGVEWRADVNHTHEFRRGGNAMELPAHLANVAEELDTRRVAATFSATVRVADDLQAKAVVATAHTRRESYYGGLGGVVTDPGSPGYDSAAYESAVAAARLLYGRTVNPLYIADLQFDHRLDNRTFSWGLQAEHERVDDHNVDDAGVPTAKAPLQAHFTNVAVFLQDDWRPSPEWTLLCGARIDRNSELADPVLSPRLAIRYAHSRYLAVRGTVATGFRAPRIFDEDLHVDMLGGDSIRIIHAPDLRKEGAITAHLGTVWNPAAYAERLALETNIFAARLRDAFRLSELRSDADGSLYKERFNTDGVRLVGAEFSVAWAFTSALRADVGLVLQRARLDGPEVVFDDGAGTVITSNRLPKSPERLAVLRLQHESATGYDWALGLRHIGPMRLFNNNAVEWRRTPSFTVIDASVARHFEMAGGSWEVRLGVQNLTDALQRDLETGPGRDSDYVYGPRQPRTWYVQVKSRW